MRTDEGYLTLPEHVRAELDLQGRQEDFGNLVGVSQQRVSRLVHKGVLEPGDSLGEWLLAYCEHLRDQAAERGTEEDTLPRERALLARAQRRGQEIRNSREMSDYAPRALLQDVLALVSSSVAQQMTQLPAHVIAECPGLPAPAQRIVEKVIARARSQWLHATAALRAEEVDSPLAEDNAVELLDLDDDPDPQ